MTIKAVQAVERVEVLPFRIRNILGSLGVIIIGIFMVVLDTTATNVALPSLVKSFHEPLSTIQWVITGYTLAQAAAIPLAGWLSDRFGSKQLFLASVVLFTVFSALASTAQTSGTLIAFRVLQGLGGGFVIPVGLAYVYRLAPVERVGMVIGMLGGPILLAPVAGPVLAGWLVQDASWRWIFLLNVPVGVLGVLLGVRCLPAVGRGAAAALDIAGITLAPLAFSALVYGISESNTGGTFAHALAGIVVGSAALVAFIVVELRTSNPLLDLRVFRSIDFDIAIVVQWVGQFALMGAIFLVPLYLQQVRGYGALDTGLALLPEALATLIMLPLGGALYDRIGARPLIVVGSAVMMVGSYLLSEVSVVTTGWNMVEPLALYGAGLGVMIMPVTTQTLSTVSRDLVGRVSALTNALQQVISSVAVATLSTLLVSRTAVHLHAARLALTTRPIATHALLSAQARMVQQIQQATSAGAAAFDDAFSVVAAITLLAVVLGLAVRRVRVDQPDAMPAAAPQASASYVA